MKRKKKSIEHVTGVIRTHPRGFGFVQPLKTSEHPQEIFIPKPFMNGAIDGDTVEVEINPESNSEKGPDGQVMAILKRGRSHLAGTIYHLDTQAASVYCPLLGEAKPVVVKPTKKVEIGERVVVKITKWGDEKHPTLGEIFRSIGHIDNPACDIEAALEEYDIPSEFPKAAILQAKKYGVEVAAKDLKGRENLTQTISITIDPETAKDFDDALSLRKDSDGHYHLSVHIADVAHYVNAGSPLDKVAQERSNSTYFPGFCSPMLPHELSDNLCSLRPDVIRLTVTVHMSFDPNGDMLSHRISRSYIQSAKRFSYEEAKEVLDGKKKSPHLNLLNQMVELCHLLKKKRSDRGSIDFALPELIIVINDKGEPTGTKIVHYDITHQLVEEFMLKANEIVAKHLADHDKPVVFRVHESPRPDSMEEFYALARHLGFSLPDEPSTDDLQKLFKKAKSTTFGQQLSVGFIRSMKLAIYSPENVGHFGLALEHYCHFTSPIRRYTDLIIQRLLFDENDPSADIAQIAQHSSEQERISMRAENSVKLLKKLRLLDEWTKKDPKKTYQATVTKVKPFGLTFEVPDLTLEGFLHISELENDYFVYNPHQNILLGRSSGKTHRAGEVITVLPTLIDLIFLDAKWELVTPKSSRRRKK